MRFLEATLGAERLRVFENEDGSIMHAEVRIDDSVVMMGEAGGDWSPVPRRQHLVARHAAGLRRVGLSRSGVRPEPYL